MKSFLRSLTLLAVMALPASQLAAMSDAEAAAGRALSKRFVDSIVSVELVVTMKVTVGDRAQPPREQKIDLNGTVVSPTGMVVTSLGDIDPKATLEALRTPQGSITAETEFKEVKLRLANGTEVPARVVLKDPDLDLAFIAPVADDPAAKMDFASVKLSDEAEAVVLGNYYLVSRAPKAMQRVPLVRLGTVEAIAEKPRRLFMVTGGAIGSPMFDTAGHLLGICLHHVSNGRPIPNSLVVLSAADVADGLKQAEVAAAAPPPEKPAPAEAPAPAKADAPAAPAKTT